MNKPLVSIIIPVFNAEEYLAETIKSAMAQTWPNKEIIIVDDGSTDNSLNIAAEFKDACVRIFNQENKGASAARNKGLSEAKGEYIQFLDADDLLSPEKVEAQVLLLQGHDFAISNCATIHFFDHAPPLGIQPVHEWYTEGSTNRVSFLTKLYGGGLIGPTYGGMIAVHAWLCSKAVIDKAGKWNEELTVDDDGEYFCRLILASREIIYSYNSICYYRKYEKSKSLSSKNDLRASQSRLMATHLKAQYLLENTDDSETKLALSRLYWELAISFYPKYINLSTEAEKRAKALAPNFHFEPYNSGVTATLSKFIGWKGLRAIQYLKNNILE